MLGILEVITSLTFLSGKVGWLLKKKAGWRLGALASILGIVYFYLIGLRVFAVLEMGNLTLMAYGGWWRKNNANLPAEKMLRVVIGAFILAMAYFEGQGKMTVLEVVASMTCLTGTYYMLFGRWKMVTAWALYMVAHVASAELALDKGQYFFALVQVISAMIATRGIILNRRDALGPNPE